jgi:MoaA/NifB/PqqE/SkfB family radical SAM enzyme
MLNSLRSKFQNIRKKWWLRDWFLVTHPTFLPRYAYSRSEQRWFKQNRVLAEPVSVKVNTGYKCNLKCPLCPTGLGEKKPESAGDLSAVNATFLASHLKNVPRICLFGWGEPFLNKEIFDIIKIFRADGHAVVMDSNLSIRNEEIVKRICESGIAYLSVSLDGVDQESYSQYRYGGSFDVALANMQRIANHSAPAVLVEWQYIMSRKNIQYVPRAKEIAKEIGIPIKFMDIGLYLDTFYENRPEIQEEWFTEEQRKSANSCLNMDASDRNTESCMYMYNEPFIDPDGTVYPCCLAAYAPRKHIDHGFQNVFGDLRKHTLKEIWNNEYYQSARQLFGSGRASSSNPKVICSLCRVYHSSKRIPSQWKPPVWP